MKIDRKAVSGTILTLLLTSMLALTFNVLPVKAESTTWTVDDDGPAHFSSIQEAINSLQVVDGDTIFVYNGIYYEHVVVNKSLSIIGQDRSTTIIDGMGNGSVVVIMGNNIILTSFTLRNSGGEFSRPFYGIRTVDSYNVTISENMLSNNFIGIQLLRSNNSTVAENVITMNVLSGLQVQGSDDNEILSNMVNNSGAYSLLPAIGLVASSGNILKKNELVNNDYNFLVYGNFKDFFNDIDTSNTVDGKPVYYLINQKDLVIDPFTFPNVGYLGIINSTNVLVKNLNLTKNTQGMVFAGTNNSTIENVRASGNYYGIGFWASSNNTIKGSTLSNNSVGIYLEYSDFNVIDNNMLSNNYGMGVYLGSYNNTISGNAITNNHYGIYSYWSINNTIYNNAITNNYYGIYSYGFLNNTVYHNNFIDNTLQVYDISWDPEYPGTPSISIWDDGYPSGGNYWSDYTDVDLYSGPYQNETGSDGIGDAPYVIDGNNQDNYPLIKPWGMPPGMSTDLVRREAWPEHHRFFLSRDGDPSVDDRHGTPGYQTLYGMVKNTGNVTIRAGTYKVVWNISDSTDSSRIVETIGALDLGPGETTVLTYAVSATDLASGKYYVEARCYYYYAMEGEKIKTFSFAVVPNG